MNDSFTKLHALLHAAWPAIAAIDWSLFGNKLVPYNDDVGIPKWTGIIMHFAPRSSVLGLHTQVYGFLPRPTESAKIVVLKTRLLHANQGSAASIELRDSEKQYWGGGIRSSFNPNEIYAISGLPEIGDHLLMAELMLEFGALSEPNWQDVNDYRTTWMVAAREHVGMSKQQFDDLKELIHQIVEDAL